MFLAEPPSRGSCAVRRSLTAGGARTMRITRLAAVLGAMSLALTAAACGGGDDGGSGSTSAAAKGILGKASNEKKLVFGVKADQPGLGLQTGGEYTGFDIE